MIQSKDTIIEKESLFIIYSPYKLSEGDVLEIPWKDYNFIVFNDKRRINDFYQCKVYTTGKIEDVPFIDVIEVTKTLRIINGFSNRFVIEKIQIPITLMEEANIIQ